MEKENLILKSLEEHIIQENTPAEFDGFGISIYEKEKIFYLYFSFLNGEKQEKIYYPLSEVIRNNTFDIDYLKGFIIYCCNKINDEKLFDTLLYQYKDSILRFLNSKGINVII